MIDVCREETFPNGVKEKLSEKTELALSLLFNILLPKNAVKLDDAVDPELFLLALYKAYCDNSGLFQNLEQQDVFCVRMIGLAQSVLSPETAKIFCEGLYYVIKENRKISERAESLKLDGGESFYRPFRESLFGLGFEYLCARRGEGYVKRGGELSYSSVADWTSYVEQKQQVFGTLRSHCSNSQTVTQQMTSGPAV